MSHLAAALLVVALFLFLWLVPRNIVPGWIVVPLTAITAVSVAVLFLDGVHSLGLGASPVSIWLLPQTVGVLLTVYLIKGVLIDFVAAKWMAMPRQDFTEAEKVFKNFPLLARLLATGWLAAIGEELIFRGFLQTAITEVSRELGAVPSVALAVSLPALLFGVAHKSQGAAGVLTATTVGVCFGAWFAGNGGNLWPVLLAHGLINSITFIAMYFIPPERFRSDA
jgi:hypothetical protein